MPKYDDFDLDLQISAARHTQNPDSTTPACWVVGVSIKNDCGPTKGSCRGCQVPISMSGCCNPYSAVKPCPVTND